MTPSKYPKMVYLSKENYLIVKSEEEFLQAKERGYCEHWKDCGCVVTTNDRISQIDERLRELEAIEGAKEIEGVKEVKRRGRPAKYGNG